MYYTELDPRTMKKVYVPKSPHEKAMQRALIQYRNPKNYDLIVEALVEAGRTDLIGFDKKCLVKPAYKDKDRFGTKRNPKRATEEKTTNKRGYGFGNAKKNGEKQGNPKRKKKTIRNVHKKK